MAIPSGRHCGCGSGTEIFDAYRRRAGTLGVGLDRGLTPHLRFKAGVSAEYSVIERQNATQDYQLLGVPLVVKLDMANSDAEPTTYIDTRNIGEPFATFRTTGTAYVDVAGSLGPGNGDFGVHVSLGQAF